MKEELDLIAGMTKVVADLDKLVASAGKLAATDPGARQHAETLLFIAEDARDRLLAGLDEVKPRPEWT